LSTTPQLLVWTGDDPIATGSANPSTTRSSASSAGKPSSAKPSETKPWLLFESHLDTVAVDGMTIEPFAAERRDGRLWGRGACDTKGTGAAMLWALQRYVRASERESAAASAERRPNNVALLFTTDEEITMTGVRSFAANDARGLFRSIGASSLEHRAPHQAPHQAEDHGGRQAKQPGEEPPSPALGDLAGVVVGEPTWLKPVTAHNGVIRWRVTTRGVAAHR